MILSSSYMQKLFLLRLTSKTMINQWKYICVQSKRHCVNNSAKSYQTDLAVTEAKSYQMFSYLFMTRNNQTGLVVPESQWGKVARCVPMESAAVEGKLFETRHHISPILSASQYQHHHISSIMSAPSYRHHPIIWIHKPFNKLTNPMYGVRLPHGHFDSLTVRQCREQISANISYMECHSMIISNWQINHLNTGLNVWSPTPTWTPTDFRRRALRCLHTIDGAGVLVLLVYNGLCWYAGVLVLHHISYFF